MTDQLAVAQTHLPTYDEDAPPAVPMPSLGRPTPDERFVRWGSWVGALALAWLISERLLPHSGLAWLLVTWFACGLALNAVTAWMTGGVADVKDRLAASVITGAALGVGAALVSTIMFVVIRGWAPLTHLNFFTEDMSGVGPKDPFQRGGILHAIIGSLIEIGLALLVTIPLGIGTAVFMTEVGGWFADVVRTVV